MKIKRYLKNSVLILLKMLILLFAVSIVTFTIAYNSPIDPIQAYIGADMSVTVEQREVITEYWGLNDPPVTRYFKWLGNLLQGDLGTSSVYRQPVASIIADRVTLSLALMATAWVLSGILGFFLGIWAAVNKGRLIDRLIKAWCLILESSPVFWVGMLMLMIFSVYLGWFPLGFAVPVGKLTADVTIAERIHHLILPAVALALTSVSHIALHTREKMIQALESDYALFAFSRGTSVGAFVRQHAIRNVMIPAVTVHFLSISELFGGSVLAETVFSYPGLGNAVVNAGLSGDMPLLLAITLFSTIFVFGGNLIANLLYPIIDPRIREGNINGNY